MMTSIPVCFYPMRKIILDDDHEFSQSILLKMYSNNFTSYNSPNDALDYLINKYQPTLVKSDLFNHNPSIADSTTQHNIKIDIERFQKMLTLSCHPDISVLLVDYHMPEMQGIEFLKKIYHLPIKKALITGENDYKIAVDAFNTGMVDAYLRKDDPDFSNKLQNIVSELEWKYFIELSSFISNIPDFDFLINKHLISAFKKFIHEKNISSFCLAHIQGNFIMRDIRNKQMHVLVRNKIQLQELANIVAEDGASTETIKKLMNGTVIPFFGDKEYWEIPANKWDDIFISSYQYHW